MQRSDPPRMDIRAEANWAAVLNQVVQSHLVWWSTFMEGWNGVTLIPNVDGQQVPFVSDASGSWGCGAYWGTHGFQWRWEGQAADWSIAPKELLPIIFGVTV